MSATPLINKIQGLYGFVEVFWLVGDLLPVGRFAEERETVVAVFDPQHVSYNRSKDDLEPIMDSLRSLGY